MEKTKTEKTENVEKAVETYNAVHRNTVIIQRMIFEQRPGISGRIKHV